MSVYRTIGPLVYFYYPIEQFVLERLCMHVCLHACVRAFVFVLLSICYYIFVSYIIIEVYDNYISQEGKLLSNFIG